MVPMYRQINLNQIKEMITNIDGGMSRTIAQEVTDNSRTMAIELEFFAPTDKADEIRNRLSQAVMLQNLNWIDANGRAFPLWVFKTDGSLRRSSFRSWHNYTGFEITSPCNLTFDQLIVQLQQVLFILNEYNCKVNKTCGMHVHHVGTRFTAKRLQNLSNFTVANEEAIDCLVSESRRGDCFYSKSNRNVLDTAYWITQKQTRKFMEKKGIKNTRDVAVNQDTHYRYRNLNLTAFAKHGTIEYRQHQGTLDYSKAVFWLAFTQAQVLRGLESVKKTRNFYQQPMQNTLKQLKWAVDDEFGKLIPCSKGHEYLIKFLIGRMASFGFADKAPKLSNLPVS